MLFWGVSLGHPTAYANMGNSYHSLSAPDRVEGAAAQSQHLGEPLSRKERVGPLLLNLAGTRFVILVKQVSQRQLEVLNDMTGLGSKRTKIET